MKKKDPEQIEDEVGDLLFTVVNLARHVKVDPSLALEKTNRKFMERFHRVEDDLKKMKVDVSQAGLELLDSLWEKAKRKMNQ